MTRANDTISMETLARVVLAKPAELTELRATADRQKVLPKIGPDEVFPVFEPINWPITGDAIFEDRYSFDDALAVEAARRLTTTPR